MWIEDLTPLVDQGLTFACIMADPAWDYDNKGTRGSTKGHYVTMGFDELKALPVAQLAAPDCHLHLWTTTPMLPQALTLMAVWGFTYKSKAVWDKELMGQGNYWRVQTEDLLLGVRGEAKHFRRRDLRNVVRVERG